MHKSPSVDEIENQNEGEGPHSTVPQPYRPWPLRTCQMVLYIRVFRLCEAVWMTTWMAMVSSQDRPREGVRSAQRTPRGGYRGCLQGRPGEMELLGSHWPLSHFFDS